METSSKGRKVKGHVGEEKEFLSHHTHLDVQSRIGAPEWNRANEGEEERMDPRGSGGNSCSPFLH